MDIFVSVTKNNGVAVVSIDSDEGKKFFPLTKRGCIAAGKHLAEIGADSWSNSSSVDFPKEVKPRFRHNVSDLMGEGFRSVPTIVQETVVGDYEIRGNQYVAIAINVKNPNDSHCFDIDPDVNNNAFIRACGWAYGEGD
jgi:hypothetical protein